MAVEAENNFGRPPVFSTPEEMISKVEEYFLYIQGETKEVELPKEKPEDETKYEKVVIRYPEPPTITGVALFLGFESRQSFYDYEKRPEFSYIVKKARLIVENGYEKRLGNQSPTGAIFALKNMGWKDKVETGITDKDGNDVTIFQIPDNGRG